MQVKNTQKNCMFLLTKTNYFFRKFFLKDKIEENLLMDLAKQCRDKEPPIS